jgi:hypothetical protein
MSHEEGSRVELGDAGSLWVVQMEGYLLKRGAGYVMEDGRGDKTEGVGGKLLDFLFKTRAAATGTLIKKGSAEKKRYFVLATQAGEQEKAPRAELRYWVSKPRNADEEKPKGVVEMSTDMTVELVGHETVLLVTPGRIYYVRPDPKLVGDEASAQARTTAGKWIHAFEFAIDGLKAWRLAGANAEVSSALHPVLRMSTKLTPEMMDKERARLLAMYKLDGSAESLVGLGVGEGGKAEVSAASPPAAPGASAAGGAPARAPAGAGHSRAKLQQSADEFEALWEKFGLHGYDALVAHFGPVLIDLERIEAHVQVRCRLLEVEVEQYKTKLSYKSSTVAADEQKTTARVLGQQYDSMAQRSRLAEEHLRQLESGCLKPIRAIISRVAAELDSIVRAHASTTQNIERLQNKVNDLAQDLLELTAALSGGSATLERKASGTKESPRKRAGTLTKKGSFTDLASAGIKDVAAVKAQIEQTRQLLHEQKEALHTEEHKHSVRMKMAMRMLHALEVERISTQRDAIAHLLASEQAVFDRATKHFDADSETMTHINKVEPAADLQATSDRLLYEMRSFQLK